MDVIDMTDGDAQLVAKRMLDAVDEAMSHGRATRLEGPGGRIMAVIAPESALKPPEHELEKSARAGLLSRRWR